MNSLFAQLGRESDDVAITRFIRSHPLKGDVLSHDADFWTASQAGFLRDAILDDAEWAEVVVSSSCDMAIYLTKD